jgi:hypothetical protein
VLVLHGGLFSQPGVLVEEMLEANRKDYNLADDRKQHKTQNMGKPTDDMVRPCAPTQMSSDLH